MSSIAATRRRQRRIAPPPILAAAPTSADLRSAETAFSLRKETFYTQGLNPFRIIADSSGSYIYVLDEVAPDSSACALALGAGVTFLWRYHSLQDRSQHRPSDACRQRASHIGQRTAVALFPVPANPIDFVLSSSYVLTLSGTPTTGDSVFPYTYSAASGEFTVNQNSAQPLNIAQATAVAQAATCTCLTMSLAPTP